ncbi:MAG: fatty acid desaturase [Candidatus Kapabacteria bacterium]|nr:fatty acid desaturase [Candidatus Kapabacteria bacterium]
MGLLSAAIIITLWSVHLWWMLVRMPFGSGSIFDGVHAAVHILIQGYLFTGLFITAHDAIHGTVSRSRRINTIIGTVCALLFAGLSYRRLSQNHHLHHAHPADDERDPDFHPSNRFLPWFSAFMRRYATIWQFVFMGAAFNILKIWIPEPRLWLFWVVPAFLGALQLFTIGTYLPHRKPHSHDMPHNARSMRLNHALAMVSCYFFGYHTEHHLSPGTPWWKLWRVKEQRQGAMHDHRGGELS